MIFVSSCGNTPPGLIFFFFFLSLIFFPVALLVFAYSVCISFILFLDLLVLFDLFFSFLLFHCSFFFGSFRSFRSFFLWFSSVVLSSFSHNLNFFIHLFLAHIRFLSLIFCCHIGECYMRSEAGVIASTRYLQSNRMFPLTDIKIKCQGRKTRKRTEKREKNEEKENKNDKKTKGE